MLRSVEQTAHGWIVDSPVIAVFGVSQAFRSHGGLRASAEEKKRAEW